MCVRMLLSPFGDWLCLNSIVCGLAKASAEKLGHSGQALIYGVVLAKVGSYPGLCQ